MHLQYYFRVYFKSVCFSRGKNWIFDEVYVISTCMFEKNTETTIVYHIKENQR